MLSVGVRRFAGMDVLRSGCVVCGAAGPALCAGCLRRTSPPPVTRVRALGHVPALFAYEGHGARIVQALKYRDGRRLVGPLAAGLAARWAATGAAGPITVSWVPTSPARRRRRGFDQAELLARALARRIDAPVAGTLQRRPGPAQTGLDRVARAGAGYRAVARPAHPVLLVDDVCTTGATLRAAAAALERAGVALQGCVVVARTP